MPLQGAQKQVVWRALIEALPTSDELDQLSTFTLDRSLSRVAGDRNTHDAAVLKLISWADARSKVPQLLLGAAELNPTNPALRSALISFGIDEGADGFEKIVFSSIGVADPQVWRDKMISSERAVCRIDTTGGQGIGTGYLISPDIVATNFHVVAAVDGNISEALKARFDYHRDHTGTALTEGQIYAFDATSPILGSSKGGSLDYAILRLSAPAGKEPGGGLVGAPSRGWLNPVTHTFLRNEPISIIQHPNADFRKFAFGATSDQTHGDDFVTYRVNTDPGSSGSPCFTHDWKLVAMHHYGATAFNRGIKWGSILEDLDPSIRQKLAN
jgi:V8-like Glu-specific endopeptidase